MALKRINKELTDLGRYVCPRRPAVVCSHDCPQCGGAEAAAVPPWACDSTALRLSLTLAQ
jgi:hypothetical protein